MKFIVDLWLDGYDTEEEMEEECIQFIEEQLYYSASSVKVRKLSQEELDKLNLTD